MVILRLVSSRSTDSISWSALKSLHSVTSSLDWRVTRPICLMDFGRYVGSERFA